MPFSTDNVEVATFISEIKGIPDSGHHYDDRGILWIDFDSVSEEQGKKWQHKYYNSDWYRWQCKLRGYLGLMNTGRRRGPSTGSSRPTRSIAPEDK